LKEYTREYPLFSLCGLNCGLCTHYQTQGKSKCPGCGGTDFHLRHPTCSVITCNQKHDHVEYCFQCSLYPCERYRSLDSGDTYISYRNVLRDMDLAKDNLELYQSELNKKIEIAEFLIDNYNDGRRKSFYCKAVNLLQLTALKDIVNEINEKLATQEILLDEKIELIAAIFEAQAKKENIELKSQK